FNDGQGFRRESQSIGLVSGGKGLGVAICDFTGDNSVDIYVANDTTDNHFYRNDGQGLFTESAVLAAVSGDDAGVSTGSMGIAVLDINSDQRPDVFVTNFERELNGLYRNEGDSYFTYASRKSGFAAYPAGFVGFGTVALDFNFDGAQDLVVANGHVSYASPYSPFKQTSLAFENQGDMFVRLPESSYFAEPHTGRGLAAGDLNNDGGVDLVFSNLEEPVAVVQTLPPSSSSWAIIRLVGTVSNRDGVGSTIRWNPAGEAPQAFRVCGGGSYLSYSDQRVHLYWTLDLSEDQETRRVAVKWPTGEVEEFSFLQGIENALIEGAGIPQPAN
ncbi:MAG: CRTAC1 family protein, partial [Aureliella sp.]